MKYDPIKNDYTLSVADRVKKQSRRRELQNRWNVAKRGQGIFQLRWDDVPIEDYRLTDKGGIKATKLYWNNYITHVPVGAPKPPIAWLYTEAKRHEL